MTNTQTTQTPAPARVQALLDLAAKRGLTIRALDDESGRMYQSRAWVVQLGRHDWDHTRILIHWMKFNDRKGAGRISLTWFGLADAKRQLRLKDLGIWMRPC